MVYTVKTLYKDTPETRTHPLIRILMHGPSYAHKNIMYKLPLKRGHL